MKNLISMTDFVLEQNKREEVCREDFVKCSRYANFLKQPLEKYMFVPCDENENVLEEECNEDELCKYCPLEDYKKHNSVGDSCEGSICDVAVENYKDKYQQAKERCLFDGFESSTINDNDCFLTNKDLDIFFFETGEIRICCRLDVIQISTIEDLVKHNIKITKTVQKQIGL